MSFLVVKEVLFPIGLFRVFLLHFSCHWVLESYNEMDFRTHATLVWAKHNGVGSLVSELGLQ